jgi:protein SCO1/2
MDERKPDLGACVRPPNGPNSGYFPNVVVVTHESRRALFYDDLLRGKTAMVHFLSTRDSSATGIARHLAQVQPYLGARLGRDVFMYSITTDPTYDTSTVLEAFAAKVQARAGWFFLTGEVAAIELIKARLFAGGDAHHHAGQPEDDCSLGMLRYGNEAAGLWGSAPVSSAPDWIARRLSWVMSRPKPAADLFKRRGPAPLQATVIAGGRK